MSIHQLLVVIGICSATANTGIWARLMQALVLLMLRHEQGKQLWILLLLCAVPQI
jgi:hypothetical protein